MADAFVWYEYHSGDPARAAAFYADVVGWSARDAHSNEAFVYSPNVGRRRLGALVDPQARWDLQQASAINARGEIVGWGYRDGTARGFKLTLPVCKPQG